MNRRERKKLIIIIVILLVLTIICFSGVALLKNRNGGDDVPVNPGNENNEANEALDPVVAALKKETYFIESRLTRYLDYIKNNPDKDMEEVIRSVNANIDYAFYTNEVESNVNDGTLIIVNKFHKLPEDYNPDLVDMSSAYTYGSFKMERTAYEHYKEMCDAAAIDGIHLYNVSAYRSYERQEYLYNYYTKTGGKDYADATSARPGYSEHQTGLASDIITSDEDKHFENTKEYAWLIANSYKYGFILRYPKDKEYITGYIFEPWHYRYVGIEVAKYIYEHDITYDEYYAYFIEK